MGKIPMGILGPLSQSVGSVTGASNKGRPTLRRKSDGGVNPRTAAQVEKRSAFAEASEYCRENRDAIIEQEHFKEKKGVTIWNQMMSWYMAGGRLTPPAPVMPKITLGGVEYDWYRNYGVPNTDYAKEAGIDPGVFGVSGVAGYKLTILDTWDDESHHVGESAEMAGIEQWTGVISLLFNASERWHVLNVTGWYQVLKLEFYDENDVLLQENVFVLAGNDGDADYDVQRTAMTNAQAAAQLVAAGVPMVQDYGLLYQNPQDRNPLAVLALSANDNPVANTIFGVASMNTELTIRGQRYNELWPYGKGTNEKAGDSLLFTGDDGSVRVDSFMQYYAKETILRARPCNKFDDYLGRVALSFANPDILAGLAADGDCLADIMNLGYGSYLKGFAFDNGVLKYRLDTVTLGTTSSGKNITSVHDGFETAALADGQFLRSPNTPDPVVYPYCWEFGRRKSGSTAVPRIQNYATSASAGHATDNVDYWTEGVAKTPWGGVIQEFTVAVEIDLNLS